MIEAGEIYFFTEDSPIGVKKHMHVCIKQMDSVLMFSACTSQMGTAYRYYQFRGWDLNTFVCIRKDSINRFREDYTFINCNDVYMCSMAEFEGYVRDGFIHKLSGLITEDQLVSIAKGVHLSKTVPEEIKRLF